MKILLVHLLIILFLIQGRTSTENKIVAAIKEEAKKLSASYPQGHEGVIRNIQGSASMVTDSVEVENLIVLQQKYQIPSDVYQRLQGIAYSSELIIQSFTVTIDRNNARMEQYIGAGYKEGDHINFAYIKTQVFGAIVPKFDTVYYRECKKILWVFKKCKTKSRQVQRGNNEQEISIMKGALKTYSYGILNTKIASVDSDIQLVLTEGEELYSIKKLKKALVVPQNGQIFVGGIGFSSSSLENVQSYGQLFGTSSSSNDGPFSLQLKNNGQLTLNRRDGSIVWTMHHGKKGKGPYKLVVTEDGHLYMSDAHWTPLFDTSKRFYKKQIVLLENYRYYSKNGQYYAQIQSDGEIVVYQEQVGNGNNKIIWNTEPQSNYQGPFSLVIEKNGNMKIYDAGWNPIWETGKRSKIPGPHKLRVTDEGVLQVINGRKGVVWSSAPKK